MIPYGSEDDDWFPVPPAAGPSLIIDWDNLAGASICTATLPTSDEDEDLVIDVYDHGIVYCGPHDAAAGWYMEFTP